MNERIANDTLKGKRIGDASPGAFGVGYVNFGATITKNDTVTIGDQTYEFFDDVAIAEGNIRVTVTGDLTAGAASDALIAVINALNVPYEAVDISASVVLIKTKLVGRTVAMSEDFTSGSNTVNVMEHEQYKSLGKMFVAVVVPNAAQVTKGDLVFALNFTPRAVVVSIATTSGGVALAWDGATTLDVVNNLVTLANGGSVDWDTADTVVVRVYG